MENRFNKLLLISLISTLIFIISILLNPPAAGFENTIYMGYSAIVWSSFGVSISLVLVVFFYSIKYNAGYSGRSILALLILNSVFLTLPEQHGYLLYGRISDLQAHIGYTKTILATGHLVQGDIYPASHIVYMTLNVFGIALNRVRPVFAILFYCIYLLGFWVLGRTFFENKRYSILFVGAATPLLFLKFHATLQPAVFSLIYIPFQWGLTRSFLYSKDRRSVILLMFISSAFVLYHPATAILGIIIISVIVFRHSIFGSQEPPKGIALLLSVLSITSIWILYSTRFPKILLSVLVGSSVIEDSSQEPSGTVARFTSYLNGFDLSTQQIAIEFIFQYGVLFIYGFLAILIMIWILNVNDNLKLSSKFEISTIAVFSGLVAVISLFLPLIGRNPVRVSSLLIFSCTVLVGIGLAQALASERNIINNKVYLFMIVLIITATLGGISNVYQPNTHFTEKEESGLKWVALNMSEGSDVQSLNSDHRQVVYLFGFESPNSVRISDYSSQSRNLSSYPKHLNDTNLITDEYFVTKEYDQSYYDIYYNNQLEYLTFYTPEDVNKLESDTSTQLIYSNGGYSVWSK